MSKKRLNIWQRIGLELIWAFCCAVGALPHFVQFRILAPVLKFLLYRVLRYRQRVVIQNIQNSFPERSEAEQREVCSGFYTTLSEIIVSTLALTNKRAYHTIIPEQPTRFEGDTYDLRETIATRSWIALTAHFGLWEYMLFWSTFSNQRLLAVYHTLKSAIFEELFKRLRGHHKVEPVPSKETLRLVMRHGATYRDESYLLGLIADQSARDQSQRNWHTFLNQDTIFFDGGEKIAMRLNLPVKFIGQHRLAPGRYEMYSRTIWDGEESIEPGEITSRYVKMLEEAIREQPELWLWSHKRWKAKRKVDQTEV